MLGECPDLGSGRCVCVLLLPKLCGDLCALPDVYVSTGEMPGLWVWLRLDGSGGSSVAQLMVDQRGALLCTEDGGGFGGLPMAVSPPRVTAGPALSLLPVHGRDPPLSILRRFAHLLEQSQRDYQEERELQALQEKLVRGIRSNQQLENDLNLMDIKIGLLVKNRITLQVRRGLTRSLLEGLLVGGLALGILRADGGCSAATQKFQPSHQGRGGNSGAWSSSV